MTNSTPEPSNQAEIDAYPASWHVRGDKPIVPAAPVASRPEEPPYPASWTPTH